MPAIPKLNETSYTLESRNADEYFNETPEDRFDNNIDNEEDSMQLSPLHTMREGVQEEHHGFLDSSLSLSHDDDTEHHHHHHHKHGSPRRTATFLRAMESPTSSPLGKRDKPTLLRSLAWSQDSQDETRLPKRRKEEHNSHTAPKLSLSLSADVANSCAKQTDAPHHVRKNSSPTMVHWEEKIEVMDLPYVLEKTTTIQMTP